MGSVNLERMGPVFDRRILPCLIMISWGETCAGAAESSRFDDLLVSEQMPA
jgi:hypothetical protein